MIEVRSADAFRLLLADASASVVAGERVVDLRGVGSGVQAEFLQPEPAVTWTVPHGLGVLRPTVTVWDLLDNVIWPVDLVYVDENTLQVGPMLVASAGRVRCT